MHVISFPSSVRGSRLNHTGLHHFADIGCLNLRIHCTQSWLEYIDLPRATDRSISLNTTRAIVEQFRAKKNTTNDRGILRLRNRFVKNSLQPAIMCSSYRALFPYNSKCRDKNLHGNEDQDVAQSPVDFYRYFNIFRVFRANWMKRPDHAFSCLLVAEHIRSSLSREWRMKLHQEDDAEMDHTWHGLVMGISTGTLLFCKYSSFFFFQ